MAVFREVEKVERKRILSDLLRQGVWRRGEQDGDGGVGEVCQVRGFDGKKLKGYGAVGSGIVGVVEHMRPFLQYGMDCTIWKGVCGVL